MKQMSGKIPIVYSKAYKLPLGPHVFPAIKYEKIAEYLSLHLEPGTFEFVEDAPCSIDDLLLVHERRYIEKLEKGALTPYEEAILEIPYSRELYDAMRKMCGGTWLATRIALEHQLGIHIGGGFHHAYPDHGEGFCMLHDVAVAIRKGQKEKLFSRVLVIDLDVHHGNGTAFIFQNDPNVFTFSMHQEHNYPAYKPPGDLDIGLQNFTDDETYVHLLNEALHEIHNRFKPDIVYYLAGADPYIHDQLGGLSITFEGFKLRDTAVFRWCRDRNLPIVITLAGGYAYRVEDTVFIHAQTILLGLEMYGLKPKERSI